ncbi:BRO-N domain-containing protein [Klebsiella quasipneumoniae]|uniref:BRO-N domain-containing protein n=1 Tax=Klebsiella quasipneumoniae TaxID=1463165 RepID=UPI00352B7C6A
MKKDITLSGKGSPCAEACQHPECADLAVLRFEGVNIRVLRLNGEPWFVAADVCSALDIGNATKAVRSLDADENTLTSIQGIHSGRGNPSVNVISESGFYKLIVRCRKSSVPDTFPHRFTNWVFRNVIPGIRKTGGYGIPWGELQDFTRRKEQYAISASKKGKALQKCRKEKRKLAEEEKRLIREYQPELSLGGAVLK